MPKYKGLVTGWLAQNRKASLWKIGFATQEHARDWLAGELGVSPRGCRRTPGKSSQAMAIEHNLNAHACEHVANSSACRT